MKTKTTAWILDSGGAGRGAWQGGVIHEFMRWCRDNGCYPQIMMGASAGGFAAGDVATGTEKTVMKGWTAWGKDFLLDQFQPPAEISKDWFRSRFRLHLYASLGYVMADDEVSRIFNNDQEKKLMVFTTRIRRRDGRPIGSVDLVLFFAKSLTRKLPGWAKYLPGGYFEEPVVFATNLPADLHCEFVRPLTRRNFHRAVEASCLVPVAMGRPFSPQHLLPENDCRSMPSDEQAVFIDGGYSLKMPMAAFEDDSRFRSLRRWAEADRTIVFCCDPHGQLWETSSRLRSLNSHPAVGRLLADNRLLVIHPDHPVEAGFLCLDNPTILRTFHRGQEQGQRLLQSDRIRRFFSQ